MGNLGAMKTDATALTRTTAKMELVLVSSIAVHLILLLGRLKTSFQHARISRWNFTSTKQKERELDIIIDKSWLPFRLFQQKYMSLPNWRVTERSMATGQSTQSCVLWEFYKCSGAGWYSYLHNVLQKHRLLFSCTTLRTRTSLSQRSRVSCAHNTMKHLL